MNDPARPTHPTVLPSGAGSPRIRCFTLGPFETNCYVVSFPPSESCWIVDASFEPEELIEYVRSEGLRPAAIVLTHAHVDHIAGVTEVRRAFAHGQPNQPPLPVLVHEAEREWLSDPMLNLSGLTGMSITAPGPDQLLRDGEVLTLSGEPWIVLHTPGHSPGGITLWHEPSRTAIVGDALFAGSVGRTDFPGSDPAILARSIREKLYRLPDETTIWPGHGPRSTIGREKRSNPYVPGV